MIHLSFDQDWAPSWAVTDIVDRLVSAGLEGTLFVTQACESLQVLRESGVMELGWHPNFLPGSSHGATMEDVIETLYGIVPEAIGARAHCLVRGTPHLLAYKEKSLRYEASDLHDGVAGLEPFPSWTGLLRIPIWFEDDVHLRRGLPCGIENLALDQDGLKVFTFHPVLLALNVADLQAYEALKLGLREKGKPLTKATREDFEPYRQTAAPGVGDLFLEVLDFLGAHPERHGGCLRRIVEAY